MIPERRPRVEIVVALVTPLGAPASTLKRRIPAKPRCLVGQLRAPANNLAGRTETTLPEAKLRELPIKAVS